MRMTYDDEANAFYLYLIGNDAIDSFKVERTVIAPTDWGTFNLDFDANHRLVGIEILFAEQSLPLDLFSEFLKPEAKISPTFAVIHKNLTMTYEEDVGAAYLYLAQNIETLKAAKTITAVSTDQGFINLDFDKDHRLLGIEVIGADALLPPELTDQ